MALIDHDPTRKYIAAQPGELVYTELAAAGERPGCSVEISRTAKGEKTWKVKAYRQDGETREDALDAALQLDEALEVHYYGTPV